MVTRSGKPKRATSGTRYGRAGQGENARFGKYRAGTCGEMLVLLVVFGGAKSLRREGILSAADTEARRAKIDSQRRNLNDMVFASISRLSKHTPSDTTQVEIFSGAREG